MDRIKILCSYLDKCGVFADVACDHGYCAEYMLKSGLCKDAVISDISEKSLKKAETLLSEYIKAGKCRSVCCDGLEGIGESIGEILDEVLIAGIGGEEIVKILKNAYIPKTFVFQPMKNAEELRAYLVLKECEITVDDIFSDGKNYYFIIKGVNGHGTQSYSKAQLTYGRDSLNSTVFRQYLREEIAKKQSYLKREMTEASRLFLEADVQFMQGVLNGEIN